MRKVRSGKGEEGTLRNTTYSSRYFTDEVPAHAIPDDSMPARAAYQLIRDELNLDGNPALNLASFVTTWMEPKAQQDGGIDVFELSERLRERGWIVPAYTLPPNAESVAVLRMVVKENFSRDMAAMLGEDIEAALAKMGGKSSPQAQAAGEKQRRIC
jgi:glutamate/tyrosine decarboxylase-like PLP-dependent enzyme